MTLFRQGSLVIKSRDLMNAGRYEVVEKLGKGTFGVVIKALDIKHGNRPLAIKVVLGTTEFDQSCVKQEIDILRFIEKVDTKK